MKRIISVLITVVLIINCLVFTSSAKDIDGTMNFKNIDELRTRIYTIFEDNYDDFYKYSSEIKTLIGDYEYFTYYMNCGACSYGFQKLLYQESIIAECMCSTKIKDHKYNFMRVCFSDTPNTISNIIIDTTYKQYLTTPYSNDFEQMSKDLPPILIYEYNKPEQLFEQLSNMKETLGEEAYQKECKNIREAHAYFPYMPQDLQEIDNKNIVYYDSEFLDSLRNNGKYTPEFSSELFIYGAQSQLKKEMMYDQDGVYRCYLSVEEATALNSGFTVINNENETVFGATDENTTLKYFSSVSYFPEENNILLIKKGSQHPVILNTYGNFLPILLSIDLRAGEDTPAIFAYTVNKVLRYGDVDANGEVNIYDVTKLQKACAKMPDSTLDSYTNETANVLKIDPLSIFNATEISRYLAKYDTKRCGHTLYFSGTTELSPTTGVGYIDI